MELYFLIQMLDCKQGGDPCCCVQRQVALTHGPVTVKPETKRTDEHGSFCFEANPLIYLCPAILACLFPVVFCRDIRSWQLKEMILCHVNILIQIWASVSLSDLTLLYLSSLENQCCCVLGFHRSHQVSIVSLLWPQQLRVQQAWFSRLHTWTSLWQDPSWMLLSNRYLSAKGCQFASALGYP